MPTRRIPRATRRCCCSSAGRVCRCFLIHHTSFLVSPLAVCDPEPLPAGIKFWPAVTSCQLFPICNNTSRPASSNTLGAAIVAQGNRHPLRQTDSLAQPVSNFSILPPRAAIFAGLDIGSADSLMTLSLSPWDEIICPSTAVWRISEEVT
jgi:hypothetical protein